MAAQAPSRLSLGHPPTAAPRRAAAVACSATRRHAVRPGSLAAPYSDQRAGTARRAEANAPQAAPAAAFDGTAAASRAATSSVIAARPAARLQGPGGALPSQAGRGALRRRRVAAPALEPAAASALRSYSDEVLATEGVTDTAPSDAALVYRDPDGFWQLKPDLKPGNPFERLKLSRDPMKHLLYLDEVGALAARVARDGFAAADDGKEAEVELDHRLKWLGFFHKRKHHYGRFMMRLKLPGGIVTSEQMRYLASVVDAYGEDGCADVTTRQNIQLRGVTLPDMPGILRRCADLGMTSLQSGLDNVRNAVGNPLAGIDPCEILDSRPATDALHAYVTNKGRGNPEISNLPRKWNVCVVGSHELWEHPHINDLAYIPAFRDGELGYNIIVGGYISATRAAESVPLDAWVPQGAAVVSLCHAVLTVFRDYGSRGNRQKCRMLWLVEAMGPEAFRAEVAARMPGGALARAASADAVRRDWERRSYFGVQAQKQAGLVWVGLNVPAGRLEAADMHGLADLAERYGSGELRLTVEQNVVVPNVPQGRAAELLAEPLLAKLSPAPGRLMAGLVACTGSQFCGFGQIETKRAAWAAAEHLESVLSLPRDVRMFWTGCPNSCGQVQVADVGLMGAMVRNAPGAAPAMVPGVDVFVGGRAGADSHLAAVTHPSVRLADLHPLLETILVESFGATRRAAPLPNPGHASRFRLASAPAPPGGAKPAPPKGTPRKAGNATHICTACGYIYTSVDPPFAATPAEYECPQCGAPRSAFKPLATDQDPSAGAGAGGGPVALRGPGVAVRLTLVEREELSGDTRRLRFSFADPLATLGLPVGNHLALALPGGGPGGGALRRAYTPVSPPDAVGFVDLVVKVYLPCARFPEGGAMTRVLEALRPGDGVDADGPAGRVAYAGRGGLAVADAATGAPGLRRAAALALVAGGSGLTPCLALIRAVFSDPADTTRVALLYANQTPADVLLRAELEAIAAAHPNFRVTFTVDRVPDGVAWPHATGFVTRELMEAALPAPADGTQFLVCGPPGMVNAAVLPALQAMGVDSDHYVIF